MNKFQKKEKAAKMAKSKALQIKGEKLKIPQSRSHAKIDKAKALKQYVEGLSLSEIARQQDVTPSAVHKALEPYRDKIDNLRVYQSNKATFQDLTANRMLQAILEKDLENEKISSLSQAYKVLNDSHRLETGQSTSNVQLAIVDLSRFAPQDVVSDDPIIIDDDVSS